MFVSDKVLFLELHKTGGSHIGKMLQTYVGGEQRGKHNRPSQDLLDRYVIGSIRNPWDWYVSLWAYGCSKKGSVYLQTTRRLSFDYYYRQLNREMGVVWLSLPQYLRQVWGDWRKPVSSWQWCYEDANDPKRFQLWLSMLLNPKHKYEIGEGYGFSSLSEHFGLLTYRYFKLFSSMGAELYSSESVPESAIGDLWQQFAYIDGFVRNEHLEDDLLSALDDAGVAISDDARKNIIAGKKDKTNASVRKSAEYYYDQKSLDLVAQRERFIIQQHAYSEPVAGKA